MNDGRREAGRDADIAIATPVSASPQSNPTVRLLGWIVAGVLRLQYATWRIRTVGLEQLDRRLAAGERIMAIFWHGKYFPLFTLLQGRNALIFTSDSFRGRIIADISRRFGYHCIATPRDHNGPAALTFMRRSVASQRTIALAVDGPLGPYHGVKPGAIVLAARLGFAIVPVSVACRRKSVLNRRWDRRELPGLFTCVGLAVGEALHIPAAPNHEAIAHWQNCLKEALEAADQNAQTLIATEVCA